MAVSSEQIVDFLVSNPGMSDAQIVSAMETYGVSPAQMAQAVGLNEGEVAARVAETIPQGQTVTLGDTIVQPVYQTTGSGETQQIGGLENVITYKVGQNQVGGGYNQYNPDGTLQRTGVQQEVNAGQDFLKFLAGSAGLFGGLGGGFESLFGGGGAAGTAGTIGNTGLTLSELTQLDLALGGAGGTLGGLTLAESLGGLAAGTLTGGLLSGGTGAGTSAGTGAGAGAGAGAGGAAAGGGAGVGAGGAAAGGGAAGGVGAGAGAVASTGLGGLTAAQIAALVKGGLTTTSGLLQQQTSKEVAERAQAMIDRETAAAKQAAQFRPVGMTTRFGSSQFGFDPVTGQLTSAGYTLSPEAKAAQDRFVKLAESGIQQAEGAQKAFEPLQTGAQSLFTLGNKYLAQSPEQVASDYLKSQMALLQPGRELELANLQNKLQQQGRGGLSVAQGGNLGATTPELQALFNARAQQEAVLAANAQREGQQNVLFGAGLLGTGAQTMGNYYGGQQAAYAPYTTAMGQVQGLETAAQQPFTMSAAIAQQAAQAGANVGRLGLSGAEFSTRLATGPAATTNPYSTLLGGIGSSDVFNQAVGGLFGSTPVNALNSNAYGPGNAGYQNMINDIYGERTPDYAAMGIAPITQTQEMRNAAWELGGPSVMPQQMQGRPDYAAMGITPITQTAEMREMARQLGGPSVMQPGSLGLSVATQPTGTRQTGPMDVNIADMARSLGFNLPANYSGTTTTVNPLLPNQQYAY